MRGGKESTDTNPLIAVQIEGLAIQDTAPGSPMTLRETTTGRPPLTSCGDPQAISGLSKEKTIEMERFERATSIAAETEVATDL